MTLLELQALGVRVRPDGDDLLIRAPRGVLTPDLRARLAAEKPRLLRELRRREIPPGCYEITDGPYAGFLVGEGCSDPERARLSAEDARRYEESRREWLRRIMGIDSLGRKEKTSGSE